MSFQLINYKLTGSTSRTLMVLYNQMIVLLVAALLGFLVFQICMRQMLRPLHSFFLGISAEAVYQTFPYNLYSYWEQWPQSIQSIFVILFLIIAEKSLREDQVSKRLKIFLGFTVFIMVSFEIIAGIFLLVSFYLVTALMGSNLLIKLKHLQTIILPSCLVFVLFTGQITYMKLKNPDVQFDEGRFMIRSGLNGSTEFYGEHTDILFTDHRGTASKPWRGTTGFWWFLFIGGMVSMIALLIFSFKDESYKPDIMLMLALSGQYIFYLSVFSQSIFIHPYLYDVYLVLPVILAFFAYLPIILERNTKHTGIFIVVFLAIAFCYSFIQLRTYAIANPLV